MKFSTRVKAFIAISLFLLLSSPSLADQSKVNAAVSSAVNFLQLVDSGRYSESWDLTSSFFKQQVTKQHWVNQLQGLKPAFGNTLNREIKTQNYTKSLLGAPDGEYVVIQFFTSFENKENATETVTPMFENDGEWRVTGDYIRGSEQVDR